MSNSETSTSSTGSLVSFQFAVNGQRRLWGSYGVVADDGGLSWTTYPDVESAKRDENYRGLARIVRLRMEDVGTECQREPTRAEKFLRQIEEERSSDATPQQINPLA